MLPDRNGRREPEVALHQERRGAIIHKRQVMQWLGHQVPESDLLVTPPARTFTVEENGAKPVQTALAFPPPRGARPLEML